MLMSREMNLRVQRAVDNFMQGYGCCQSVVARLCEPLWHGRCDRPESVAAGFGGGRALENDVRSCVRAGHIGRTGLWADRRPVTAWASRIAGIKWCNNCWGSSRAEWFSHLR